MHPDKIEELTLQAIANFAKLEVKVVSIETSITLLRVENDKILQKISESLEKLASINEKMSSNANEHKNIYRRLDELTAIDDDMAERLHKLELEHEVCMERQKKEDAADAASLWTTIKKSAIPIIVGTAITFALWMVGSHMEEYLEAKNGTTSKGAKP